MLERLRADLRSAVDPEKAAYFPRFFKAGPGQYAEGDKFLGVTVPQQRAIARKYRGLWLGDIEKLIRSPWHEERLTGLFLLVDAYRRGTANDRQQIYNFYVEHTAYINNWDLVDSSAPYIVGPQLQDSPYKLKVLEKLARSDSLWERRIAMLSTFHYIRQGRADEALVVAEILLHDTHDLIHKAVGWMLREIGKRCHDGHCPVRIAAAQPPVRTRRMPDTPRVRASAVSCAASPDNDLICTHAILKQFLDKHAAAMPRTALRYAIEHFDEATRRHYLRQT